MAEGKVLDQFCIWWEMQTKAEFTFPDTSNTHFQSYCEAAGVLLSQKELILQYLDFALNKKQVNRFSHMEKNLWDALHFPATLSELAVLALYDLSAIHI